MKKFIFGLGALIVIGIFVVLFHQKHNKVEVKQKTAVAKYSADSVDCVDSVDAENRFYSQSLSDKDIYFKADTLLPDIPVINDMVDVANGYAILRAAAEQYVKTLMNIMPKDTALS
ncbi:MAG: hypothetical protein J6O23_04455 [Prevotella sp.]|nr:hypothetical protein [Prevotella sp.]